MSSPSKRSQALPRCELFIYVFIVFISYGYATYQLFKESQAFRRRTLTGYGLLQPGWKILGGRYQDIMTSEWTHWKFFTLHPTSLAVYAGHMTGGYVVSRLLPEWRTSFVLFSSLLGALTIMGLPVFGLILSHALIAYTVVTVGCRVWLLWVVVLLQLAMTVLSPVSNWQLSLLPNEKETVVKFIICGAFCSLRFIGFGVAYLKRLNKLNESKKEDQECDEIKKDDQKIDEIKTEDQKPDENQQDEQKSVEIKTRDQEKTAEPLWTLRDYLLYVFYLPTIAHGPYIQAEGFFRQIKQAYYPSSQKEVSWVCLQWLRPLLNALLMEALHHYLYVSAFSVLPNRLNKMSPIAVVSFAEWCTLVFQIQYMVYYGCARALAMFDGVLVPELPVCFQTMYRAQDSWRYFDRGEHQFILRNIYFALGGSQRGVFRQFLALTVSFCFTCYWHGCHGNVLCMVTVLWVIVQLEVFLPSIARTLGIMSWVKSLSCVNQRRLSCLLHCIKYPIQVWSVVVFLTSLDVGKAIIFRSISQVWVLPCVFAVHYCHIQLVKEFEMRWGKKYLNEKLYMAPPQL